MSQLIHTRNTSNMIELLESKFEERKLNLTEDLKNDLAEIKNLIQNQSNLISGLTETITRHESTISI